MAYVADRVSGQTSDPVFGRDNWHSILRVLDDLFSNTLQLILGHHDEEARGGKGDARDSDGEDFLP